MRNYLLECSRAYAAHAIGYATYPIKRSRNVEDARNYATQAAHCYNEAMREHTSTDGEIPLGELQDTLS